MRIPSINGNRIYGEEWLRYPTPLLELALMRPDHEKIGDLRASVVILVNRLGLKLLNTGESLAIGEEKLVKYFGDVYIAKPLLRDLLNLIEIIHYKDGYTIQSKVHWIGCLILKSDLKAKSRL